MITELKSIPDIWKRMPSEMHARRFLEGIIWSTGRHCPHCGSVASSALRGRTCRPGLYQCRDCRLQFTVTTLTPMHGTKLDLRIWICAMFLVLTSSKGISSIVMARLLGVNQKTAWKMGHAIRELMDDRNGELLPLEDIVEVDEAYVGGAPKSLSGAYNPPGKGTGKPMIFVAASRDGQARARVVSDDKRATLEPALLEWIDPETTSLMTDGSKSYRGLGKTMADHQYVIHSQKEYANPETGAHVNTAEAVISQVQRALVGVYHNLGRQHLQRYLDEIVWRWNHRDPIRDSGQAMDYESRCRSGKIDNDLEADLGGRPDVPLASGGGRKANPPLEGIWAMLAVMPRLSLVDKREAIRIVLAVLRLHS